MTGSLPYIALVLIAGSGLPLQALINGRLAQVVGGPVQASVISFAIGTLSLLALLVLFRGGLPTARPLAVAGPIPWWLWTGGLFGAVFVTASAASVQTLGAALMVSVVVGGQMAASLLLDHYGVLGAAHAITWPRVAGALLVVAGVVLIQRG